MHEFFASTMRFGEITNAISLMFCCFNWFAKPETPSRFFCKEISVSDNLSNLFCVRMSCSHSTKSGFSIQASNRYANMISASALLAIFKDTISVTLGTVSRFRHDSQYPRICFSNGVPISSFLYWRYSQYESYASFDLLRIAANVSLIWVSSWFLKWS